VNGYRNASCHPSFPAAPSTLKWLALRLRVSHTPTDRHSPAATDFESTDIVRYDQTNGLHGACE
jgi:hypothetical protein